MKSEMTSTHRKRGSEARRGMVYGNAARVQDAETAKRRRKQRARWAQEAIASGVSQEFIEQTIPAFIRGDREVLRHG